MKFMRPCWVALLISFGMMTLGYCGYCGLVHLFPNDPISDFVVMFAVISIFLMMVGGVGLAAALVWCLVDGIVAFIRFHHQKS